MWKRLYHSQESCSLHASGSLPSALRITGARALFASWIRVFWKLDSSRPGGTDQWSASEACKPGWETEAGVPRTCCWPSILECQVQPVCFQHLFSSVSVHHLSRWLGPLCSAILLREAPFHFAHHSCPQDGALPVPSQISWPPECQLPRGGSVSDVV